jgi:hypothetical protein
MKRDEEPWIEDGHDSPHGFGDPVDPEGSDEFVWNISGPCPSRTRPSRSPDFDRAWAELLHVHALTEARILREACRLRQGFDREASCTEGDDPRESSAGRPSQAELRLALWRTKVQCELELALVDGVEPHALSRFCAAHAIHRWPTAQKLAQASIAVEDCSQGRGLL